MTSTQNRHSRQRRIGLAIGLGATLRGADAIDIAYHVTMLPLLVLTLRALVRRPARGRSIPVNQNIPVNHLERSPT